MKLKKIEFGIGDWDDDTYDLPQIEINLTLSNRDSVSDALITFAKEIKKWTTKWKNYRPVINYLEANDDSMSVVLERLATKDEIFEAKSKYNHEQAKLLEVEKKAIKRKAKEFGFIK